MWRNTRLVVFTAITASLYAAILIPFKVLPLVPGVTEFRPANAVPVVCSFLFGPAAAFGAAIGNLIGDLFAGIGPGDLFGFAGNFLYGLIPYRAWRAITDRDPAPHSGGEWIRFLGVTFLAAGGCSLVVGWGLNSLGFVPFPVLANVVLWNNFIVAAVLAPLLLRVLHPRVKAGRLLYSDLMPRPVATRSIGRAALVVLGAVFIFGGHVAGNLIYTDTWLPPWLPAGELSPSRSFEIGFGLAPFVVGAFVCFLLL